MKERIPIDLEEAQIVDMDTLLITGGAGFLGSHLAVATRRTWPQAHIIAVDNLRRRGSELILRRLSEADVEFTHGDVRTPEDLEKLPPADFLLECSAEPSVLAGYETGPRYVLNTNLFGTVNCLEYARRCGAKVIFFSTSRVYPMERLNHTQFVEQEARFAWTDDQTLPGVSSKGVTELCREVTGNTLEIGRESNTRTADVKIYLSDCVKLSKRTGWRPARTARETVAGIATWIRQHETELGGIVG